MSTEENKVSKDMAEADFERFVDAMDLDLDTSEMDAEDLTGFKKQKSRVVNAIQRGALIINDDGEAVYTPYRAGSVVKEPLTFHERTGASIMAMDGKKKGHNAAKMYAVLADMCKVQQKVFAGLVGEDGKICEAIFAFLMD